MNINLKSSFAAGVAALAIILVCAIYYTPGEKYVGVVEEVQEKTVMLTVPTIMEQTYIVFTSSGVEINTSTVAVSYSGAGVFVSPNGLILSCAHVVDHDLRSPIIATLSNGTTVAAYVLYKSTDSDLALLKIAPRKVLRYELIGADSSSYKGYSIISYSWAKLSTDPLRLGQEVIAVGNPYTQPFSTSHGIISHLKRDIGEMYRFTQVDAPVNPGNSGGPLFNLSGELIGIVSAKVPDADGLGLAISPPTIKELLGLFK